MNCIEGGNLLKTIVSVLVSFIAVVACCLVMQCNAVKASAAYDFSIIATELTAAEGDYAQAGDYKVEVYLADNEGFATYGLGINIDAVNFTPVMNEDDELVTFTPVCPNALIVAEYDSAKQLIGGGAIQYTNADGDGVIFGFYLRRNPNSTDTTPITNFYVDQIVWQDPDVPSNKVVVEFTVPTTSETHYVVTEYIVGDVDGDGEITEFDAQIVDGVLDANGGTISAADFEEDVPFYEYDGVVCIGVVDVDNDGDIDAADGQEILRYHVVTEIMSGTYTGNVGTTGYLYATEIVSFDDDN